MNGFTAQELIDVARRYSPILLFDKRQDGRDEQFFPISVESWLAHVSSFPDAVPSCPRRGTSVWTYPPFQAANCPGVNPGDLNLVPASAGDPDFIGANPFRTDEHHFVDFGGWAPYGLPEADAWTQGNLKYLADVYDAIRPISWPAGTGPATPQPTPAFPDFPPGLATYCEVVRGDDLAELAFVASDDPEAGPVTAQDNPAKDKLADYLVLTYHYFYPCMQPFKEAKFMEGQWESISVFVKMFGNKLEMRPRFIAYSQGYRRNNNNWWVAQSVAESWSAPTTQLLKSPDDPNHPLAYVSWGTHGNFFGSQLNPINTSQPNTGEIVGAAIFVAGWVTLVIGIIALNPIVAVVGLVIAFIGWLIALIASLCGDNDDDESSEQSTYIPEDDPRVTDHHNGEGPSVAAPGSPPAGPGLPGPQTFILRLIDPSDPKAVRDSAPALDADGQPTEAEYPYWWDYVGRFGVVVDNDTSKGATKGTWMHGSRRVDPSGVSRAVINMRALLDLVSQNDRFAGPDYDL
jgi:hypothetical protein